jgi:hemolysin activation/secretion protein
MCRKMINIAIDKAIFSSSKGLSLKKATQQTKKIKESQRRLSNQKNPEISTEPPQPLIPLRDLVQESESKRVQAERSERTQGAAASEKIVEDFIFVYLRERLVSVSHSG